MLIWDILRSALRSLLSNRLRTFLTMLGVVIGVGAVVGIIALGEGARINVESQIKAMGTNLLWISPGSGQMGGVRGGQVQTLVMEDAETVRSIEGVAAIAPETSRNAQVKRLAANFNTQIVGTTPEYAPVRSFTVEEGTFIEDRDVQTRRRVCVLGSEAATELFGEISPIGDRVQIKGISFEVVGILKSKGDQGFFNPDRQIIVPLPAAQRILFGMDYLTQIGVQVADGYEMSEVTDRIDAELRRNHRIMEGADADFNVRSQTEILERMNQVTGTFTALLGGVAAVSLLVGGIGIMNIMLVSVRERTREIGIRKAVGARRRDILLQFLIEAVVVSVLGGFFGIAVGYGLAALISHFANWQTVVPMYAVLLAVSTSAGIGILFGVWPARIAALLDPVEALRYE